MVRIAGDEMEVLLNANAAAGFGKQAERSVVGNETEWQMVINLSKSRLGGIGKGGLLEGEPRSNETAWKTFVPTFATFLGPNFSWLVRSHHL